MAKIALSDGFSLLPEGEQVLKITDVKYKEAFGKMEIYMETLHGVKHIERFSLLKSDGSSNVRRYRCVLILGQVCLG